jgi:signal transduction histidine kinase
VHHGRPVASPSKLDYADDRLRLSVTDDGAASIPEVGVPPATGTVFSACANARSRFAAETTIASSPGQGTRVENLVPFA